MINLIENDSRRQKISQGALNTAKQEFWDWDTRISTEVLLVDSLMNFN